MNSFLKSWLFIGIIAVVVATAWTDSITPVEQCRGESFENLPERIQVKPCGKTRCKLPKNSNVTVVFKFKTKQEVKTLVNDVSAEISGIPLPFIGVSGTSACDHITHADTGEAASCPLAAGQEYVYTNVFPVLSVYPAIQLRVHWSLNDGNDKVICFEVPAVITSKSAKKKSLL
ncbi:NPC intracellular cholesterol transporter 2-like [Anticarsia gemmatalis]|uniref:NPC intracellular cholesterol transporter 2-like n=1 Tax=Anticarsia gemmatalis TaxID=129554 RepID=UPI003F773B26